VRFGGYFFVPLRYWGALLQPFRPPKKQKKLRICFFSIYRMSTDDITLRTKKDKLIRKYAVLRMEGLGEKADRKLNDVHSQSVSANTGAFGLESA